MAKRTILVFPFPLLAHYLRLAELLIPIKNDHEILFAGGTSAARYVEELGFSTFPCANFDPDHVLRAAQRFDFSWLDEQSLRRTLEAQISAVETFRPQLIISDAAQTARIAAETTSTPHLALVNSYMTRYSLVPRGVPQTHPARKYQEKVPPGIFQQITRIAEAVSMWRVHRPFRRLRREFKVPACGSYLDEFLGDVTALCDSERIFPVSKLPHNLHVIGPIYYSGRASEVTRLLLPNNRKIIYVTMGSSGVWEGIRLLDDPKFSDFVVVVSGRASEQLKGSHVIRSEFIDPNEILPRASLVICHGGNGTLYQALAHGVPTLVRPTIFEQEWNVARFEELGLVRRIAREPTSDEFLQLINETIADTEYRVRLKAEARTIRLEETQTNFSNLIKRFEPGQDSGGEEGIPLPGF